MAVSIDLAEVTAVIEPLLDAAAALALRWFRSELGVHDKGGALGYDPVTEVDRGIETLLREGLAARFPDHAIVGEEHGSSGPADARASWIIDPIDGTRAFISGSPEWGTLVGLRVDGRPAAGWAEIPYLDERFAAVAGEGWFARQGQRRPLRARREARLEDAVLRCTHPAIFNPAEYAAFKRLAARVRLQRWGGDCYSYCLLALGHVDLVVESSLQAYDIVPLIPIIEAAGGVVTDLAGEAPLTGGMVVAAANRDLHARALAVLKD
ncbi:MAG TPA: inositol monophosphatase family protein [Candidatus Dormibacteraeota bacterium]|nr:inositol monophosphatase family protein [Candidatus Dormibacteraeota bacterium]